MCERKDPCNLSIGLTGVVLWVSHSSARLESTNTLVLTPRSLGPLPYAPLRLRTRSEVIQLCHGCVLELLVCVKPQAWLSVVSRLKSRLESARAKPRAVTTYA